MKRVAEECVLPIKLTDHERLTIAHKAADLQNEVDKTKAELAAHTKEKREEIKRLDDELRRLLVGVQTGELMEKTNAERVLDIESGLTWIEYNGTRFFTRDMTHEERQGDLFDDHE